MPLVCFEHINENASWALWEITESKLELENKINLNDIDKNYIASFKSDFKRKEWLASRVTVKHMLTSLGEDKYAIKKDDCGKPHLLNCKYHMSISHSNGFAAVILNKSESVGIDIEQVHEKIRRIEKKFLSDEEKLATGDNLEMLCMYWSAKEVLYKIYGRKKLELKKDLFIHPFSPEINETCVGEIRSGEKVRTFDIHFKRFKEFIIAFNA